MTESEQRQLIVDVARSWIGTRYLSNAMIKGPRGGVDCAMLLVDVYRQAGIIPMDFDPRPYPEQWHMNKNEEEYLKVVLASSKEVAKPTGPGDIALFKVGRLFAHGAIVTTWPCVVHSRSGSPCVEDDISKNVIGKHALGLAERRFFTFWNMP